MVAATIENTNLKNNFIPDTWNIVSPSFLSGQLNSLCSFKNITISSISWCHELPANDYFACELLV